jgi:hypothetical protein
MDGAIELLFQYFDMLLEGFSKGFVVIGAVLEGALQCLDSVLQSPSLLNVVSSVELKGLVMIMDSWAATYVFPFCRFDPDSLPTHSDCHEDAYAY